MLDSKILGGCGSPREIHIGSIILTTNSILIRNKNFSFNTIEDTRIFSSSEDKRYQLAFAASVAAILLALYTHNGWLIIGAIILGVIGLGLRDEPKGPITYCLNFKINGVWVPAIYSDDRNDILDMLNTVNRARIGILD